MMQEVFVKKKVGQRSLHCQKSNVTHSLDYLRAACEFLSFLCVRLRIELTPMVWYFNKHLLR